MTGKGEEGWKEAKGGAKGLKEAWRDINLTGHDRVFAPLQSAVEGWL